MKHTPGPWIVQIEQTTLTNTQRNTEFKVPDYFIRAESAPVCHVTLSHEANARLIAAAPELLEALREAVEFTHDSTLRCQEWKALITKATGEVGE